METALRNVRLSGALGKKFGRVHRLAVQSLGEAVAALRAILPGFEAALLGGDEKGVRYACFVGKTNVGDDALNTPYTEGDFRIAPVVAGAKSGIFQVVLGAALMAAAFWGVPAIGLVAMGAQGVGIAPALFAMGASLALGGVMQMVAPQQLGLSVADNVENGASYNFNGPVNTTAQGNCYPVLYGEMFIGSQVLSAGIFAEDQV